MRKLARIKRWVRSMLILVICSGCLIRSVGSVSADETCPQDSQGSLTAEAAAQTDCLSLDHIPVHDDMTTWPLGDLFNPAQPMHTEVYRIQGQVATILWRSQQIALAMAQLMGHWETKLIVLGNRLVTQIRPVYLALFAVSLILLTQMQALGWFGAAIWGEGRKLNPRSLIITLLITASYLASPLVFLQLSDQIRQIMVQWGSQIGQDLAPTLTFEEKPESHNLESRDYQALTPYFEINLASSFLGITQESELYREGLPNHLWDCCFTYIDDPFSFGLLTAEEQIWHKAKSSAGIKRLIEGGLFFPYLLLARGSQFLLVMALLIVWLQFPWDFLRAILNSESGHIVVSSYIGRYGALWREAFFNALFFGMVNGILLPSYQQLTAVHLFGIVGIGTVVAGWRFRGTWQACQRIRIERRSVTTRHAPRAIVSGRQQARWFRRYDQGGTHPTHATINPYLTATYLSHTEATGEQNPAQTKADWRVDVTPLALELNHQGDTA